MVIVSGRWSSSATDAYTARQQVLKLHQSEVAAEGVQLAAVTPVHRDAAMASALQPGPAEKLCKHQDMRALECWDCSTLSRDE